MHFDLSGLSPALAIILGIAIVTVAVVVVGFLVKFTWNGGLASVTRARPMTFGNAIAFVFLILLIAMIAFGWSKPMPFARYGGCDE